MDQSPGQPRPQDAFNPRMDNSNAPFKPHLAHWQAYPVRQLALLLVLLRPPSPSIIGPCELMLAMTAKKPLA